MPSGTYSEILAIGSYSMTRSVSQTADTAKVYGDSTSPITLTAGKAGVLTTRTDANTGVITSAAHGFNNADIVDVYDADNANGVHYGMTVSNAATNTFDVDAGAGTDLPTANANVCVAKQVLVNVAIDGDVAKLIGISSTTRGHADFHDSGNTSIRAVELQADEPDIWDTNKAGANPYTGNAITHCHASSGNTANATFQVLSLEDSTP